MILENNGMPTYTCETMKVMTLRDNNIIYEYIIVCNYELSQTLQSVKIKIKLNKILKTVKNITEQI